MCDLDDDVKMSRKSLGGVDFVLAHDDGWMPRSRGVVKNKLQECARVEYTNKQKNLPVDDDGGDLAKGDEERARASV